MTDDEKKKIEIESSFWVKTMQEDWSKTHEVHVLKAMNFWIAVNKMQGILFPKVSRFSRNPYHLVPKWKLESWREKNSEEVGINIENF